MNKPDPSSSTTPANHNKPGNFSFTPHDTLDTPANVAQRSPVFRFTGSSPQDPSLGASTSLFDSFSSAVVAAIGPNMARENKNMDKEDVQPSSSSQPTIIQSAVRTVPAYSQTSFSQPLFGTTSTLQNQLPPHTTQPKKPSIFYIPKKGVPRPEHHRPAAPAPAPAQFKAPTRYVVSELGADAVSKEKAPHTFKIPFTHSSITFGGGPGYTSKPLPTFSSNGDAAFQPIEVKASKPRDVQDLTLDDSSEDEYNPDAYIKESSLPLEYISPDAANENIKALLEGALDDDAGTTQKRRLPRRKRPVKAKKDESRSLADKLKLLNVNDTKEAQASVEEDADEDAEDDGTVDGLSVKLLPHQIDGVSWMMDKESGQKVRGIIPKGGILADDMGLGKTIQALSLILMNPRQSNDEIEAERKAAKKRIPKIPLNTTRSTLVVAPLALIRQWESEIETKTDELTVLVHHGSNRTKSPKKLESYDVVITTYQTLTSEHENSSTSIDGVKVGCMGVKWYRVILDEAHSIKNKSAKMTKACYALSSVYRWCMTGTPMQNNLDELQSLIRFLNIKPYCDYSIWKAQITTPMKNGRGDLAMRRLQTVLTAFMKRRTKDVLKKEGAFGQPAAGEEKPQFQIVDRKVELLTVEFSEHERMFYDKLESRAQENLASVMNSDTNSYMAVLVLLLRLRQSCNHPRLPTAKTDKDLDMLIPSAASAAHRPGYTEVDDIARLMDDLTVETKKCDMCRSALTSQDITAGYIRCGACEGDLKQEMGAEHDTKISRRSKQSKKSKKAKVASAERQKLRQIRKKKLVVDSDDDEDAEWIVRQAISTNSVEGGINTDDEDEEGGGQWLGDDDSETGEDDSSEEESDSDVSVDAETSLVDAVNLFGSRLQPSTKIRHLLDILRTETPSHKVIVFSEFTSMLDIIEPFLRQKGYKWARYDGSMRNDARESSLRSLREDRKTRILLCSLKCGSLGLNLTAASRVVLMEPFWNPAIEDQAIDRVHRLNQTQNIIVYRLTVAGTIEDRILQLQEKKRELAAAALGGDKNMGKLNMKDLLELFKHDNHEPKSWDSGRDAFGELNRERVIEDAAAFLGVGKAARGIKGQTPVRKTVEHPVYGRR